jgi:hypothetical protein
MSAGSDGKRSTAGGKTMQWMQLEKSTTTTGTGSELRKELGM